MGRRRKLLERILSASSDANIPFEQTRTLLLSLSFIERVRGSYHGYMKEGILERITLQPTKEGRLKPCQVRQLRAFLIKYQRKLGGI